MLKWFTCPDEERVEVKDCWKGCRLGSRCLTLPTLVEVGTERKWTGEGSTTQLLNGTMYSFLTLTKDFTINPRVDRIFALHGTAHHKLLEGRAATLGLPSEISLTGEGHNVFDLLEPEGDGYVLTDYKTWGAFKVAKTLGIVVVESYKESYNDKAGRKRTRTINIRKEVPEQGDWLDISLQMNRYRMMIEAKGLKVVRMQIQVTVRDGGLKATQNYGIKDNIYKRNVPLMDNGEVEEYFYTKQADLATALIDGEWSNMCSLPECWDGVRCARFCEVWQHCPRGKQEHMGNG